MIQFSRRSVLRAGVGAVTVGLAGCSGTNSTRTPSESRSTTGGQETVSSYKYDAARTGVVNATLPGSDATEQWATDPDIQNAILMEWAAIHQQRVYAAIRTFGQFPAAVVAFDHETGTVEWRHATGGSAPALAGDSLFIADDRVRALATSDGSEQWVATPEPDGEFDAPAVVDDTVYATSGETVYAFDAEDGSVVWATERGGNVGSPVAVAERTVYAGHASPRDGVNEIVALDAADGSIQWQRATEDGIVAAPAIMDGVVYASTNAGTVYALDATDGTERWRQSLPEGLASSPSIANGRLYIRTQTTVSAHDLADGSVEWQQSAARIGQSFQSPLTVADDGIVVLGGNTLAIHDSQDGAKRYELSLDEDRTISGATVVDGTIYVGGTVSGNFDIFALGA